MKSDSEKLKAALS